MWQVVCSVSWKWDDTHCNVRLKKIKRQLKEDNDLSHFLCGSTQTELQLFCVQKHTEILQPVALHTLPDLTRTNIESHFTKSVVVHTFSYCMCTKKRRETNLNEIVFPIN